MHQSREDQLQVDSILPKEMDEQVRAGPCTSGCGTRLQKCEVPGQRDQAGHWKRRSAPSSAGAVVFGISAPQGFGKTTAMQLLQALFEADGFKFKAISIDDFYLPASWQEEVANVYSDNALMQSRGNAGTHDVRLGEETLKALKSSDSAEVLVPSFDKSALNGRGDQVPKHSWTRVHTPCDVVVLEGWMVGFKAGDSQAVAKINPDLKLVNEKLKKYQDPRTSAQGLNAWQVYVWRKQAEEAMKRSGRRAPRAVVASYGWRGHELGPGVPFWGRPYFKGG
eukprot:Skav217064  [mRNA]  locus=scaffold208:339659:355114:+ [translate_table: standard]